MSYAVKPDGNWRAVNSRDDLVDGEAWSDSQPPLPQTGDSTLAYVEAVQRHLDVEAQRRKYDGILSACSYATSTVNKFRAEGQACVEWRDAVWSACYELLARVESGSVPEPSVDELIAVLPPMIWPA